MQKNKDNLLRIATTKHFDILLLRLVQVKVRIDGRG